MTAPLTLETILTIPLVWEIDTATSSFRCVPHATHDATGALMSRERLDITAQELCTLDPRLPAAVSYHLAQKKNPDAGYYVMYSARFWHHPLPIPNLITRASDGTTNEYVRKILRVLAFNATAKTFKLHLDTVKIGKVNGIPLAKSTNTFIDEWSSEQLEHYVPGCTQRYRVGIEIGLNGDDLVNYTFHPEAATPALALPAFVTELLP